MNTLKTAALILAFTMSAGVASAQTADPAASAATTVNTTHTAVTSVQVSIQNNVFDPHNVVVSPGTTIRWTNLDSVEHSIVADKGAFQSGMIPAGGTYSRVFSDPGTYLYYDPTYGGAGGTGMFGIIVVLPAGSPALSQSASGTPATPGVPNTGAGGDAAANILMLSVSALIVAAGTRALLRSL